MRINESPVGPHTGLPEAITITVALPEDIPALQSVAATCWWATYGELLSASFIENFLARAYRRDRLLVHLADTASYFLVVKSGDDLVGFGQVGPTLPRQDDAPVAPADLYRLYLLPQWQWHGIGTHLLVELESWLCKQHYPYYGAYVHERNEPAKTFYDRRGFRHTPECDIQDEWYLVKRL
jgi:diamine N-acetyltransferase